MTLKRERTFMASYSAALAVGAVVAGVAGWLPEQFSMLAALAMVLCFQLSLWLDPSYRASF